MSRPMPTIETDRLWLRPWRDSDIDGFAVLMSDPGHAQFVGGPLPRDEAWRKMATYAGHWLLRGYAPFALELKATRTFVGYCGPWNPLGWPEAEIAWGIVPACAGRGYVTEAARRALTYVYETLGWMTAVSVIATDNLPSIRVAERLGAVLERTTENRGFHVGVYRHVAPSSET